MRVLTVSAAVAALFLAGCFSPRQAAPPSRASPAGTVEMFKLYARQRNPAGEWDILSPAFKQRLSRKMGRNLDVGDYVQARKELSTDPQVQKAERFLQNAVVTQTVPDGPDAVKATIVVSGGPFLTRGMQIRLVKRTRWQLFVRGQTEPYWGILGDPLFGADRRPDGSYVLWYRESAGAPRSDEVIPAANVVNYKTDSRWYVDDLGGMESEFMR